MFRKLAPIRRHLPRGRPVTLSLPGLAPFISEFLVLIGTFTRYPMFAVRRLSPGAVRAIYVLWMYQRMMTGPVTEGNERLTDLKPRNWSSSRRS